MHAVPYFLMAAVHFAVLIGFILLLIRDRSIFTGLLVVVVAGLVYDNVMIPMGTTIGYGETLKTLSEPRFFIHGVFTPSLMLFAAAKARDMGVPWAQRKPGWVVVSGITAVFMVRGFYNDVLNLQIETSTRDGFLRYTYVHPVDSLVASVVTVIVLIVIGVTMQRSAKWPWMLAGSVFMFLASSGGTTVPYVANIGETVLAISLLATGWYAWQVKSGAVDPKAPRSVDQTQPA